MKFFVYSRWDGDQKEFKLDAERALDALSDLMMHGLSVGDAMQYMRQYGFEMAGQDFRVMGMQELTQALRKQMRQLASQYNMREATSDLKERWSDLLGQEEQAVHERHGFESLKMNDFMERRHAAAPRLADAIERFADYEFEDEAAADAYDELRQELERLRALEEFLEQYKNQFRGRTSADYETAQRIREQFEASAELIAALQEGKLEQIDPEQLREVLGENAHKSLIILRDLDSSLRERGFVREQGGKDELTPAAVRRIGAQALAQVYSSLRKGRQGGHATSASGAALQRPDETRPYRFGDSLDIDVVRSTLNALQRGEGRDGKRIRLQLSDLEVREKDFSTQTTTVLLLDLSWSMSFEGRFPAAKRVALAMHQLIRTQFPRDHFFIVGFSTRARELRVQELPEVSWDPGDPFTNLQEGLMVAERLITKHPSPSPQILVITDGQPTAYFVDDELHVEWPSGYGGISPRAVAQTLRTVRRITQRGITINTFMLHDSPELVGFVERLTEINHGRALFTDPQHLGSYVMVDHLTHRRRRG